MKLDSLIANTTSSVPSEGFSALSPDYIFDLRDADKRAEYERFLPLPSVFNQSGDPAPGIVTTHDEFAISFTQEEQIEKVEALLATRSEAAARRLFRLCSQSQWNYGQAKKELRRRNWRAEVVPILYRPFDVRFTVYDRHVAVHRRDRISQQMRNVPNRALISCRQRSVQDVWRQAFSTRHVIESTAISNKTKEINYLFPLWLAGEWPDTETRANIDPGVATRVSSLTGLAYCDRPAPRRTGWDGRGNLQTTYGPQDVFDWIYAVMHSESYRARYREFLKGDFARVPLPRSARLFEALAERGRELVDWHLLEPSKFRDRRITDYAGPGNPEVGRVGWSDGTVWLNAGKTTAREGHRATRPGTAGFHGVPEGVWDFHIGAYQVCHKWLKDRKGRRLSNEDVAHYQKIVVALNETVRIMADIDRVIDAHGGWPGAFEASGPAEKGSRLLRVAETSPPYEAE